MTGIVHLHRVELTAGEKVILRHLSECVIYVSFSYIVDIVDGTFRQE